MTVIFGTMSSPKVNLPNQFDIYEHNYTKLDEKIKILTREKETLRIEILEKFEEEFGHEGHSVVSKMSGNTIQRILNVYQDINDIYLKKLIYDNMENPDIIWGQITVDRVSQDLFTNAVKNGDISAILVAKAITSKEVEKLVIKKRKKNGK